MKRALWPLIGFLVLAGFLAVGLNRDPHEIPSPLIGRPAPRFTGRELDSPGRTFSPQEMAGKVWLLNVWASWCGACREEHPVWLSFAREQEIPVIGLDYKDEEGAARRLLRTAGNPYRRTVTDPEGRVGMDYGVYGVPETYLIDREGRIRFKQIGPMTPEVLRDKVLPLVKELER